MRDTTTKKRWNFKKLDEGLFNEVIEFLLTAEFPEICKENPEEFAMLLIGIVKNACNVSAPVVSGTNKRKQTYWWSIEIAQLRTSAIRARRAWTRSRRRGCDKQTLIRRANYKTAKKEFRKAIRKAKDASWRELISTINRDPWGIPFKLVMGKLRAANPSLSEILDEDSLTKLVDSLFPRCLARGREQDNPPIEWVDEMDVSIVEVLRYVKKRTIKNTAPGPDNIKAFAWKRVPGSLLIPIASMFTLCLREGVFPGIWKRAALVLIPKGPSGVSDVVGSPDLPLR